MSFFTKPKLSLSKILSTFTRAKEDLELWEELSATEQAEMEAKLKSLKEDQTKAAKAREALEAIIGN